MGRVCGCPGGIGPPCSGTSLRDGEALLLTGKGREGCLCKSVVEGRNVKYLAWSLVTVEILILHDSEEMSIRIRVGRFELSGPGASPPFVGESGRR